MNNFRDIHTKKTRTPEEIQKLGNKVLNYVIGRWGNNIKNIICKNDPGCTYPNCKFFHPSKNNNDSNKISKKISDSDNCEEKERDTRISHTFKYYNNNIGEIMQDVGYKKLEYISLLMNALYKVYHEECKHLINNIISKTKDDKELYDIWFYRFKDYNAFDLVLYNGNLYALKEITPRFLDFFKLYSQKWTINVEFVSNYFFVNRNKETGFKKPEMGKHFSGSSIQYNAYKQVWLENKQLLMKDTNEELKKKFCIQGKTFIKYNYNPSYKNKYGETPLDILKFAKKTINKDIEEIKNYNKKEILNNINNYCYFFESLNNPEKINTIKNSIIDLLINKNQEYYFVDNTDSIFNKEKFYSILDLHNIKDLIQKEKIKINEHIFKIISEIEYYKIKISKDKKENQVNNDDIDFKNKLNSKKESLEETKKRISYDNLYDSILINIIKIDMTITNIIKTEYKVYNWYSKVTLNFLINKKNNLNECIQYFENFYKQKISNFFLKIIKGHNPNNYNNNYDFDKKYSMINNNEYLHPHTSIFIKYIKILKVKHEDNKLLEELRNKNRNKKAWSRGSRDEYKSKNKCLIKRERKITKNELSEKESYEYYKCSNTEYCTINKQGIMCHRPKPENMTDWLDNKIQKCNSDTEQKKKSDIIDHIIKIGNEKNKDNIEEILNNIKAFKDEENIRNKNLLNRVEYLMVKKYIEEVLHTNFEYKYSHTYFKYKNYSIGEYVKYKNRKDLKIQSKIKNPENQLVFKIIKVIKNNKLPGLILMNVIGEEQETFLNIINLQELCKLSDDSQEVITFNEEYCSYDGKGYHDTKDPFIQRQTDINKNIIEESNVLGPLTCDVINDNRKNIADKIVQSESDNHLVNVLTEKTVENNNKKYINNLSDIYVGYIINNILFKDYVLGDTICYKQIEDCREVVIIKNKEIIKNSIFYDKNINRIDWV
jgi:hypothetical protein